MSSLINKRNILGDPRHFDEAVLNVRRGGVTQERQNISLPPGNHDFAPSLRYASSTYTDTLRQRALIWGQNQDFNLGRIYNRRSS